MINPALYTRNAWTGTGTLSSKGSTNVSIPAGIHNGNGYVTCTANYEQETGKIKYVLNLGHFDSYWVTNIWRINKDNTVTKLSDVWYSNSYSTDLFNLTGSSGSWIKLTFKGSATIEGVVSQTCSNGTTVQITCSKGNCVQAFIFSDNY